NEPATNTRSTCAATRPWAVGAEQEFDSGANGGLGQLHLAHIFLRQINRIGDAEDGLAVERAKPVLPLAVRKRAVGLKAPVLIHAAVRRQFPDDVQQTAATQPHRLGV